jgi:peptidylprolyl isomerase
MSAAATGDTVRVHYTGTLDDGSEFDSSSGGAPLEFQLGEGNVIPGFEGAVLGMAVGDSKTVNIEAANAYGPHHPEGVQEIERSAIPEEVAVEIGGKLQAMSSDNEPMVLTVVAIGEGTVTLDANHPLAGKDLSFEIELVEIV